MFKFVVVVVVVVATGVGFSLVKLPEYCESIKK
jgi:hypothetical protein